MNNKRLVVIESPFAGDTDANTRYARACIADSISRGEAPIASHMLYTQDGILNDSRDSDRALGISTGHCWISVCDSVVVYTDRGISQGMKRGIEYAVACHVPIEYRILPTDVYKGLNLLAA